MSNEPLKTAERQQNFFLVIGTIFGLFMIFVAGTNAEQKNVTEIISNLIIGALFIGTVVIAVMGRNHELKARLAANERDAQARIRTDEARNIAAGVHAKVDEALAAQPKDSKVPSDLIEALDTVFGGLADRMEQERADLRAMAEVVKDLGLLNDKPNPKDYPTVAESFHIKTGRYLQITHYPDGQFSTDFSDKPFAQSVVEGTSANETAEPQTTSTTTTTKRRKSAAQQRKANLAKGHGAITDAELKIKKAAERKAKKAADKAAAETSTTTTTVAPKTDK